MLGGAIAGIRLPIAQFPEITPPQISVSSSYPGADAVAVEQSVATPIEQQVNGVERMIYMRSTNASDGTMTLTVAFEVGSDANQDNILVQNRVSQANPFLPQDVRNAGFNVRKATSSPMMFVSIYSPNNTFDQGQPYGRRVTSLNDARSKEASLPPSAADNRTSATATEHARPSASVT